MSLYLTILTFFLRNIEFMSCNCEFFSWNIKLTLPNSYIVTQFWLFLAILSLHLAIFSLYLTVLSSQFWLCSSLNSECMCCSTDYCSQFWVYIVSCNYEFTFDDFYFKYLFCLLSHSFNFINLGILYQFWA